MVKQKKKDRSKKENKLLYLPRLELMYACILVLTPTEYFLDWPSLFLKNDGGPQRSKEINEMLILYKCEWLNYSSIWPWTNWKGFISECVVFTDFKINALKHIKKRLFLCECFLFLAKYAPFKCFFRVLKSHIAVMDNVFNPLAISVSFSFRTWAITVDI